MRVAFVLLIAGVALLMSGCSGGSGKGHSGRGAYFDAIEAEFGCVGASPKPTQSLDDVETEIADFAALTPPPDVAAAHKAMSEAGHDIVSFARDTSATASPSRISSALAKASAFRTAESNWQDALVRHYGVRLFSMEGASMEPAFYNGDVLALAAYNDEELSRWQLIVFKSPLDESRTFLKRIVALPGEMIEIRDGTIDINGTPVEDDNFALASANYDYGPKTVPGGSYFVLGDNRRNSYDSHAWGAACLPTQTCDFVPKDLILGVLPASGNKTEAKWWCR
jgi:signal peptidase I